MQWALDNENQDWNRIIWTDDASIQSSAHNSPKYTVRRPGHEYDIKHIAPSSYSGRKNIKVWEAIAY